MRYGIVPHNAAEQWHFIAGDVLRRYAKAGDDRQCEGNELHSPAGALCCKDGIAVEWHIKVQPGNSKDKHSTVTVMYCIERNAKARLD